MSTAEVPLSRSALLVIDIQDSFKVGPRWELRDNPAFQANVERLIAAYRKAGLPVLFFLHSDPDPGFETSSPHYRLMEWVRPAPGEPLLHKTTRNCFTSTDLDKRLRELGVGRLAISGISTEQCCETTTRVAADLGFQVDFVMDATMTFPIPLVPGSREGELSCAAVRERTAFALRRRFARITGAAELVAELAGQRPA
jgi:nicotinamidase-related amidase